MEVEKFPRTARSISLFTIPSFIGIWMFMVPFSFHGSVNTFIGHFKEYLMLSLYAYMPFVIFAVALVVILSNLLSLYFKPKFFERHIVFAECLHGGPFWYTVRFAAMIISCIVIWGDSSVFGVFLSYAEMIVLHLVTKLLLLTFVLSLTAPLLLDFGLVQFFAVYAEPIMQPLFKVPGRSAVDSIASWMGSSSIAVVLTAKMHMNGSYSDREAAVMVTSFSLAGIYNIYAVTSLLNMNYVFGEILLTVYSTMLLLAIIMPRIWPLKFMQDKYYTKEAYHHLSAAGDRHGHTLFEWALYRGLSKASHMNLKIYLAESLAIAMPLIFGTIPLMVTFGTFLMFVAESTPIVTAIAYPISVILTHMGVAEAEVIASSSVFAFVDQYVAVTYGQKLLCEAGRFICICISTVGLVNLTEIGLHVWHSTIPLSFKDMLVIYLIRIIISFVIIIPVAGWLFG